MKRQKIPPPIRRSMFRRHGLLRGMEKPVACSYCDALGVLRWEQDNRLYGYPRWSRHDGVSLSLDHVLPVALGGSDDPSNLEWACHRCNAQKGARRDWSSPNGYLVDGQRTRRAA